MMEQMYICTYFYTSTYPKVCIYDTDKGKLYHTGK